MYLMETFEDNYRLMEFINSNENIVVISTHTTPGDISFKAYSHSSYRREDIDNFLLN